MNRGMLLSSVWRKFSLIALISCPALNAHSRPLAMRSIPGQTIRPGASIDELLIANTRCERRRQKDSSTASCSLEKLSIERHRTPPRKIKAFYLDRTEVSRAAYLQCSRSFKCRAPKRSWGDVRGTSKDPVVNISYYDALNFCRFRHARLPSEAEYELAARGSSHRLYPWGNFYRAGVANVGRHGLAQTDSKDGFELLAPVDSFFVGATPQGVLNLAGNAAEWTSTSYGHPHAQKGNFSVVTLQVVKGGDYQSSPLELRATARRGYPPELRSPRVGFRCARPIKKIGF